MNNGSAWGDEYEPTAEQLDHEDMNRFCSKPDFRDPPSEARLTGVRQALLELDQLIYSCPAHRWTTSSGRVSAEAFVSRIALMLVRVECNADLLRVEDRLLNCRAVVESRVKGRIACY